MLDTEDSEAKSRRRKTGQPLIDITNDSPIVGLASESLNTPLTSARKAGSGRIKAAMTPGSGEALLRGQVKYLLQMVKEETEFQKLPCRPFVGIYRALNDSPLTLLAPANTPQVPGDQLGFDLPSPIVRDPIIISQAVNAAFDVRKEEEEPLEVKSSLTRSLMLEFLEKDESDISECDSTVTILDGGVSNGRRSVVGDDDKSSCWSMQVNASPKDEDDEKDEVDESSSWSMQVNGSPRDEDDEVVYKDDVDDDELCSELSRLSVNGVGLPQFTGKHIRFVYISDGEGEVELMRDVEEVLEATNPMMV